MSKFFSLLVLCFAISSLVACCGGSSSTPPPTPTPTPPSTIQVSPASAAVVINGSQVFTANASGVTWSLTGPGTINANGVYQAPASFPSPSSATVTATLGSQTGHAGVQVVYANNNQGNQGVPIKLGTSGGNVKDNNTANTACCIGTLGSLLQRGASQFILSNNHVLARSSVGVAGEAIDQPGQLGCPPGSQGLNVANLTQQAALKPGANETAGPCAGSTAPLCGHAPSNVDAAIAQIVNATVVDPTGSILDLGAAGPTSIADAPPSATVAAPVASQPVAKSGRTTGLTCSSVLATNTTVIVAYESSCGGTTAFDAYFNNQVIVNGGSFSAGGDSGSLIVTSDTARPVALLYAGNSTSTAGNPLADVLAAFNNGTAPTLVGGADHAVSCLPTATAQNVVVGSAATTSLSAQERARGAAALAGARDMLSHDSAVNDVQLGASADNPHEAALVVEVRATPKSPIPAMVSGVRTRVLYPAGMIATSPDANAIKRTVSIKEAHENSLFALRGVQGVGVGRSDDNPAETAIVVFTLQGASHAAIPATMDGVRTKVVDGDKYRAFGWNEKAALACSKPKPAATAKPKLKAKVK